jgi:hypothetical protein
MVTVNCDVCKKKIDDSTDGRTFFRISRFSICEPCRDNLELAVRPVIRTKEPFSMDWYSKLVVDTLDKQCGKGKKA